MTVVDRSDKHLYQPGFLFLPFGKYEESDIIRQTRDFMPRDVEFIQAEVDQITPENHAVALKDGRELKYDLLIVATGCRTAPEETAGMLGPKWRVNVHDFYTLDGARALREKLKTSKAGAWWCTSTKCRSSARWLRWSSPSSRTRFSASRASATKSR
jgi:sulfide:quinone oxidoreductase